MEEGQIVLTTIPQDSLQKTRPVLLLRKLPGYGDFLVCAVSTQLHQFIPGFDLKIQESESLFKKSGLMQTSIVRLSALAVLPQHKIQGAIGKIPNSRLHELQKNLADYLTKNLK